MKKSSLFFALYGHCVSYAQSKQRVASPAMAGFPDLRKCCRPPNDDTRTGASGENQWHMISTSLRSAKIQSITGRSFPVFGLWHGPRPTYWQLFVINEKLLSLSFDQFPRT